MANQEQLERLKNSTVEEWNQWREDNSHIDINLQESDLTNINLIKFNLTAVDLSYSNLSYVDLSEANLYDSNLSCADLSHANLYYTELYEAILIETKLNNAHLHSTSFAASCLSSVDLSDATCHFTNFSVANLSNANLSNTDLTSSNLTDSYLQNSNCSQTLFRDCQALRVDFTNAILTGACIEGCNIYDAIFENITCDYIYFKYNQKTGKYIDRKPSDENKIFNPGDFKRLIEKTRETVDLIFSKGIDWDIFLQSFNQIGEKLPEYDLTISAIEKKSDGVFVVKVEVPQNSDKSEIEASFWKQYQPLLDAKDAHIKSLESNNKFLQQEIEAKRQENTEMSTIIKILAAKDNNVYNFQNAQISGGFASRDYKGDVNNDNI